MLASLTVRDIVLIERAELGFLPGLNVLTGETGAGKSILLDALGLAAGGRGGGRAASRPGADQGTASAVFEILAGHPARALLAASGIESEDAIILRRTVFADGRTRAFINDRPVGVALLRDIGAALLEIHGQADDRGLFDSGTHRRVLDQFGGHMRLADETAARHGDLARAEAHLAELRRVRARAAEESAYLAHAAEELASLAPEPGEEERLALDRALLMNAGRIAEEVGQAAQFVGGETGAESALGQALRKLSRLAPEGRKAAAIAETALETALAHVQEARAEFDALLARLETDPARQEKTEERLFALRAVARKFNVAVDGLADLRAAFEAKLAALDSDGTKLQGAAAETAAARDAFLVAARALSAARAKAAKGLDAAVARELAPLKLGHARFRVALAPLSESEAGPGGLERVSFEIATVEGAAFGPLGKIASGGELARFSLALKVALAEADPPAALVFDEVDRGVGGAVADAVGERLQRLAEDAQVLLVTHAPQVAARARRHFRIARRGDATEVHALSPEERVEEIARMISGAAVTDEARAAARRLIAEAAGGDAPKKKRARA